MIVVIHFVYYYFNIIASCTCILLIDCVPHHGVSPANPAPVKQYHCYTVGLHRSYTAEGEEAWAVSLIFF